MKTLSSTPPPGGPRWQTVGLLCMAAWGAALNCGAEPPAAAPMRTEIDASSLHRKVLCGYQGWFRCPGDGTDDGWLHWSRNPDQLSPASIAVEMWPDLSDFDETETYPVPGFLAPGSQPARLFSSANRETVLRHFRWMQEYGIDGVFLQRFLVNLEKPSFDTVLEHVRSAAAKTGRVYAICYDLTAAPPDRLFDLLSTDWKGLVDDAQIVQDDRYLTHNGKPVLIVWGLFSDRFDAALAHRMIDFFESEERYAVTLIGGCPWPWRDEPDQEWAQAYRRLDIISPWNVGNYALVNGQRAAATASWEGDLAETRRNATGYLPVIYPGFGWTNLKGPETAPATIGRRGGEFFWEQFVTASELGIDMAYVAMFDELDEATAILKVADTPPTPGRFQTYEGLPSDWYLRLTGEGTKVLRGERKATAALPIQP